MITNNQSKELEAGRLRQKTLSFYDFDEDKSALLKSDTPRNSDGSLMGFAETDQGDIETN